NVTSTRRRPCRGSLLPSWTAMGTTSDPETAALIWFLDAQRSSVLAIIDGLPEDALRAKVLPSGWTPIGLNEHLGHAERHWVQQVMLGAADDLPWPVERGAVPHPAVRSTGRSARRLAR